MLKDPERYDLLNLGGVSYFDTFKSVTSKLIIILKKSKNQSYVEKINQVFLFAQSFLRAWFLERNMVEKLLQDDSYLSQYEPWKILEACLHLISLSPKIIHWYLLQNNLEHLFEIFEKGSYPVKYRVLMIFKEKMDIFITSDNIQLTAGGYDQSHLQRDKDDKTNTFISRALRVWEEILLSENINFKTIATEILTALVTKYWSLDESQQKVLRSLLLSKVWNLILTFIPVIDQYWMDALIDTTIEKRIWDGDRSKEICELMFKNIFEDVTKNDPKTLSIKSKRLFESIKLMIKTYKDDLTIIRVLERIIPDFLSNISTNYGEYRNIVFEELLCITWLIIKHYNSNVEVLSESHIETNFIVRNAWIVEILGNLEIVYRQSNKITSELSEAMKYFCQTDKSVYNDKDYESILKWFIQIGIEELNINNANRNSHITNGWVYLQTMIILLSEEQVLKNYFRDIIQALLNKVDITNSNQLFLRPIALWILSLLWHSQKETLRILNEQNRVIETFSIIVNASRQVRYPTEHKILILSLINYLRENEQWVEVPNFNLTILKNMIHWLTWKLKFENESLAREQEEGEEYLDDSDDYM